MYFVILSEQASPRSHAQAEQLSAHLRDGGVAPTSIRMMHAEERPHREEYEHSHGYWTIVPYLPKLHEAGAPVHQLDKRRRSAHELITKSMPDSHAPELLGDVVPTKEALKAWGAAARAVHKMGVRHAQVLPHANSAQLLPTA